MLSGEIALKNNHYYYYYFNFMIINVHLVAMTAGGERFLWKHLLRVDFFLLLPTLQLLSAQRCPVSLHFVSTMTDTFSDVCWWGMSL